MSYPISENAERVNAEVIGEYLSYLFEHVDWSEGGIISVIGIGEKGTKSEGVLRDRQFVPADAMTSSVLLHARRWAQYEGGTFIVPAVVNAGAVITGDVQLDKIQAFTALMVDLDSGDTAAKLAHAETALGQASMIVNSGGRTAEDSPKIHAYWKFLEPSADIARIAAARKLLAQKVGGDQAFGRATQIIRVPGTLHCKNSQANPVELTRIIAAEYDVDDLIAAIEEMAFAEGVNPPQTVQPTLSGMDFSGGAGRLYDAPVVTALTEPIHEGGVEDRNRWTEFSRVAGLEIANARKGVQTLERARELTYAWMMAKMDPPWPLERFTTEFTGVLKADITHHGPVPEPVISVESVVPPRLDSERVRTTDDLLSWAAIKRSSQHPAPEKTLVKGLLFAGKKHMLVAEGGAGKTFLCMDLALSLACASADHPQEWTGMPVLPDAYGGTVIMITAEDDVHELDRRWHRIDPDMRRRKLAGDRLIALPMDNLGGAFPLAAVNPATRQAGMSQQWAEMYSAIRGIRDRGGHISAIIIDTLNATLHGDENSALVISEYLRVLAPIVGDLRAAVLVTHHVRKPGAEPIKEPSDMLAAVRGSGALTNGMRMVLGVWPTHDYYRRMKAMAMEPKRGQMFSMATIKWNAADADLDTRTLLRGDSGLLADVTVKERASRGSHYEQEAWMEFCIGWYADNRVFFTRTGANGVYNQRAKLHPCLRVLGRADLEIMVDRLLQKKTLITRIVDNAGKTMDRLDLASKANVTRYVDTTKAVECDYAFYYYDHGWDEVREK